MYTETRFSDPTFGERLHGMFIAWAMGLVVGSLVSVLVDVLAHHIFLFELYASAGFAIYGFFGPGRARKMWRNSWVRIEQWLAL